MHSRIPFFGLIAFVLSLPAQAQMLQESATPPTPMENMAITKAGWTITLNGCRMIAQKGEAVQQVYDFPFSGVCRFVGEGAPRIIENAEAEILLVESSTEIDSSCDTSLRALIVKPSEIAVSNTTEKSSMCTSDAWDVGIYQKLAGDFTVLQAPTTAASAPAPADTAPAAGDAKTIVTD